MCDLNGIFNRKYQAIISDLSKSEISDKNSLNQCIPVSAHLSEIIELKKRHGFTKSKKILPFLAKFIFNTIWLKISTYQPLKLCNNVQSWCKDGWDICGLFRGNWLKKCLPIDLHWIRNYGNMCFGPKSLKFLQGVDLNGHQRFNPPKLEFLCFWSFPSFPKFIANIVSLHVNLTKIMFLPCMGTINKMFGQTKSVNHWPNYTKLC